MKKDELRIYLDYAFKTDSTYIGEKLCRSDRHADNMRKRYEEKYGEPVEMFFVKRTGIKNGKCVF